MSGDSGRIGGHSDVAGTSSDHYRQTPLCLPNRSTLGWSQVRRKRGWWKSGGSASLLKRGCVNCPQTCDSGLRTLVSLDCLECVSCKRGDTGGFGQAKYLALLRVLPI